MAIRAAIGAGRSRIIRQLLTESVLLSFTGGGLGMLLGFAGIRALLALNTANLPMIGDRGAGLDMDWRVLAFTGTLSLFTGILFGLAPALHGSRADLNAVLKDSSGRSGTGLRQNRTRSLLVISEVALAVVLLIGSALLIRTSIALRAVHPGFDSKNVLTMRMSLAGPRFRKSMEVERMIGDSVERIRAIPGVINAAATCCVPLRDVYVLPFIIEGRPLEGGSHGEANYSIVSGEYFDVYRIPVKRGRPFTSRDVAGSPAVVMINEAMAKKYWKDGDALNQQLTIGKDMMRELRGESGRQIIGIVADVHDDGLDSVPAAGIYVPQAQVPDAFNALNAAVAPLSWVVRTQGNPYALTAAVREQLRQSTGLPVSDIQSMDEVVGLSTAREFFNTLLMTIFGGSALLLAAIGIYGLIAFSVEQRRQEIGIRLALGAGASDVRRMVVVQGLRLALVGIAAGLFAALGLTRLLASLLFGVDAHDPLVFSIVPVVLAVVALAAVWLPAARAGRVSPIECLRYE